MQASSDPKNRNFLWEVAVTPLPWMQASSDPKKRNFLREAAGEIQPKETNQAQHTKIRVPGLSLAT